MVLFNPPYVVTSEEEYTQGLKELNGLKMACGGGPKGILTTQRFLNEVGGMLAPKGSCFLLLIDDNQPEELLRETGGLGFELLSREQFNNEAISIFRLFHKD